MIENKLSEAPAEFNDGHHAFQEISLNLRWRQVLEQLTQDDMDIVFAVLRRREAGGGPLEGLPDVEVDNIIAVPPGGVHPVDSLPDTAGQPKGGKKRGKSGS